MSGPQRVRSGHEVTFGIELTNTGTRPVPVLVDLEDKPQLTAFDPKGEPLSARIATSCHEARAVIEEASPAAVILLPGGTLHGEASWTAAREKRVGPSYHARADRTQTGNLAESMELLDADGPCHDVPVGKLRRGKYTIKVLLPLFPRQTDLRIGKARASIRVE